MPHWAFWSKKSEFPKQVPLWNLLWEFVCDLLLIPGADGAQIVEFFGFLISLAKDAEGNRHAEFSFCRAARGNACVIRVLNRIALEACCSRTTQLADQLFAVQLQKERARGGGDHLGRGEGLPGDLCGVVE